jgi:pSer/pThr/pTyr-binding forkhead associated (FHA) protein
MAVLRLSFGDSILKELWVGAEAVTIGRSPQNDICVDNPAVSFHHARIFAQSGVYYVQDVGSLNGTFLNGVRITQAPLSYGDVITVGKHTVRFARDIPGVQRPDPEAQEQPERQVQKLTGTMILDTRMRRELQDLFAKGQTAASSTQAARMGKLTVLKGRTTQKEYLLTSHTSLVGKSNECAIRLKGWFAPKIAAMITKQGDAYQLSPSAKKVFVNGVPLTAKVGLAEGDVVAIGNVQFQFNLVAW